MMAYCIVALALITTLKISTSEAVKVAAFNVQVLGQTKISKSDVTDTLVKIINRYDIILIQEIRDSKGDAINILLERVNAITEGDTDDYEMVISERLGRSSSKEQYAFFYRKNIATVKASYTYADKNDDFEREPYIVQFHIPSAAVSDLVFIAIHAKPKDAVSETDKLVDVYDDVVKKWKTKDIVILGDLNAACTYVKEMDWGKIRLANDKRFWWLIDDCQDTTVKGSRCAYDRIIATGEDLLKNIVARSPGLFDFQKAYGLDKQKAGEVSDHFPVEFQLKQKGWKEQETVDYVVSSVLPSGVMKGDVQDVISENKDIPREALYMESGGMARIMLNARKNDITSAISCVQMLQRKFGKFMGHNQTDQAENYLMKLQSETHNFPYQVFSMYKNVVDIKLIWDIERFPITCQLVISKYL